MMLTLLVACSGSSSPDRFLSEFGRIHCEGQTVCERVHDAGVNQACSPAQAVAMYRRVDGCKFWSDAASACLTCMRSVEWEFSENPVTTRQGPECHDDYLAKCYQTCAPDRIFSNCPQ
jgi:hypothetical protein